MVILKLLLDTAHLAFILADKLGQVEMIELDLQEGEQLIMPGNIEEAGYLNISRVRFLLKCGFRIAHVKKTFRLRKATLIAMESTSIQLQAP